MSDYIRSQQTCRQIDSTLKAFADAENDENKGLVLYIRNGQLAFDTEENLFTITSLT